MKMNWRTIFKRLGRRKQLQLTIELAGGMKQAGSCQQHAARKTRRLHIRQIQGSALPRGSLFGGLTVHLHTAHPCEPPGGVNLDLLVFFYSASNQRAGNHRAKALHREYAIDRQSEMPGIL